MIATHDELMTVKEVARLMSVSETTILRWVRQDRFPAPRKFGRAARWSRKEVQELIESAPRRGAA